MCVGNGERERRGRGRKGGWKTRRENWGRHALSHRPQKPRRQGKARHGMAARQKQKEAKAKAEAKAIWYDQQAQNQTKTKNRMNNSSVRPSFSNFPYFPDPNPRPWGHRQSIHSRHAKLAGQKTFGPRSKINDKATKTYPAPPLPSSSCFLSLAAPPLRN